MRYFVLFAATLGFLGCAPSMKNVAADRPLGQLLIVVDPADAELTLSGRFRGVVAGPIKLPIGSYRVELSKDGFFLHYAAVQVHPGEVSTMTVKLRKRPF